MTDVPQRRARAKRSPVLPSSSLSASTSPDRRPRSGRSGGRPSLPGEAGAPDAAPPGTASSTENPKPTARTTGRSAGEKRANGSGSVRLRGKAWTARLSLGEAGRPTFTLPTCRTEQEANARLLVLSELAGRLLAAGQIVLGVPLLEQAAAREGNALRDVRLAIDQLCKGEARARATGETTFAEFAERVLSGKLAEQYPDHVKAIRSADDYRSRLAHVLDVLGPVPLVRLTIDHADRAMSLLPGHLEPSTRRNVAMVVHRILSLAVYPARLIGSNPLPRGWVPKADHDKAKGYLYPDEDQLLMGSKVIPLCFRIYYGFLIREGMRADEAGQLEWSDVDLDRGAVVLDENKTDEPRAWALSSDVVRALRKWREICPDQVRVFVGKWGCNSLPGRNGAERFRDHLRRAGITRPELFETTDSRLNIRLHDTRATFITIKLSNGRTETWISDRTGHKSSGQIHHYKRAARKVAELGLGDFAPLDEAIPELTGKERSEGTPAPAGPATRAASAEAAIAPAQTVQAPARADLSAPVAAEAEAPEEARLGPRWAKPTARVSEPQAEPIEIIDLIPARSSAPGKSLGNAVSVFIASRVRSVKIAATWSPAFTVHRRHLRGSGPRSSPRRRRCTRRNVEGPRADTLKPSGARNPPGARPGDHGAPQTQEPGCSLSRLARRGVVEQS